MTTPNQGEPDEWDLSVLQEPFGELPHHVKRVRLCGTSEEVEHITPRAKCAYLASTQIRDDMYYARQIVTRVLLGPSVDTPQARAKAKDTGLEVVDWPLVVPPSPDP